LDAGNVVAGTVISAPSPLRVETAFGIFELEEKDVPVSGQCCHKHSPGEKVNLLIGRRNVQRGGEGGISGVVTDVVFHQDGFKVTLANGLDFYLPDAPRVGEKINLVIPKSDIKCLS
jgi:hypothetical protein